MTKTAKSSLTKNTEVRTSWNKEPNTIDVYLIDTMFLLHTLSSLPAMFGGVAKTILSKACSFALQVHLVCEMPSTHLYVTPDHLKKCWPYEVMTRTSSSF